MLSITQYCVLFFLASFSSPLDENEGRFVYQQSFKLPYKMFETVPNFQLSSNTLVTNDYLRLSQAIPNTKGSIWSYERNSLQNFRIVLQVSITSPDKSQVVGSNGIAVWFTKQRMIDGPLFGSVDEFDGLGIFLDTFDKISNTVAPYVYGIVNNGTVKVKEEKDPLNIMFGGCGCDFRNIKNNFFVRITYKDKHLKVETDSKNKGLGYTMCFDKKDLELPEEHFLGVSASSSEMPDNHDIIKYEMYDLDAQIIPDQQVQEENGQKLDDGENVNTEEERMANTKLKEIEEKLNHLGNQLSNTFNKPHVNYKGQTEGSIDQGQLGAISSKLDRILNYMETIESRIEKAIKYELEKSNPNQKTNTNEKPQYVKDLEQSVGNVERSIYNINKNLGYNQKLVYDKVHSVHSSLYYVMWATGIVVTILLVAKFFGQKIMGASNTKQGKKFI